MEGFRTLKQGSRVRYELVQGPKGDMAQDIRPVEALEGAPNQPAQAANAGSAKVSAAPADAGSATA
jgi:cold shock protein